METVQKKAQQYADEEFDRSLDGTFHSGNIEGAFRAGYDEALRWRDPKVEPPTNQDVVLVKTDKDCYATAYYHGKTSGFITYGEDAYVEFGEIIGWRPIE